MHTNQIVLDELNFDYTSRFVRVCVSSLRRGHANLLCIVPILTDDPRRESNQIVLDDALGQAATPQHILYVFLSLFLYHSVECSFVCSFLRDSCVTKHPVDFSTRAQAR